MIVIACLLTVVSYFAGSIPSGILFGRLFTGTDVRSVGSGNIGAANVSRLAGFKVAALVLLFDMAKGFIPVELGAVLGLSHVELAVIAGVAVLGHDFSAFLHFSGGKGVATSLGVFVALAPLPALCALVIWLVTIGASKYSSLASLVALFALPLLLALFDAPAEYIPLGMALVILTVFTHRENLSRLLSGDESRVGRSRA